MQDHREPPACSRSAAKVSSSAARVWITSGSPSARGQLEVRLERAPLVLARRVVAVVVEPGLADRAHALVARPRARSARCRASLEAGGLVRVAADDRDDLVVARAPPRARARSTRRSCRPWRCRARPPPRARSTSSASGGSQCRGGSGCRSRLGRGGGTRSAGTSGSSSPTLRAAPTAPKRRRVERASSRRAPRAARAVRVRHERVQQHGDDAEALGERVEDRVEMLGRAVVLGELPRLLVLHVAVEPPHALPDLVERAASARPRRACRDARRRARRSSAASSAGSSRLRHHAVAVAADHRQRAAGEVAVLVGELGRCSASRSPRARRRRPGRSSPRASGRSAARRCRSGR